MSGGRRGHVIDMHGDFLPFFKANAPFKYDHSVSYLSTCNHRRLSRDHSVEFYQKTFERKNLNLAKPY